MYDACHIRSALAIRQVDPPCLDVIHRVSIVILNHLSLSGRNDSMDETYEDTSMITRDIIYDKMTVI